MTKWLTLLTVVLQLAILPAFAADSCDPMRGSASQSVKNDKSSDRQSDRSTMAAHCFSCHHANDRAQPAPAVTAQNIAASAAIPLQTQHFLPSLNSGPLLEPPTLA